MILLRLFLFLGVLAVAVLGAEDFYKVWKLHESCIHEEIGY